VPIDHLCSQTSGRFRWSDIMRRHLRNLLFSLKANLSFASRLRILPFVYSLIVGHALFHFLKGDFPTAKSDFAALAASRRDKKRVLAARRQVSRIRKVSDAQIFKTAMKRPPLKDLLRYVRGNM